MVLFVAIAACIMCASILYKLIPNIKEGRYFKAINDWFWMNVGGNLVNIIMVWSISLLLFFGLSFVLPWETSEWEFNINALEDHLVTEGQWYGRRGYVDGELSYFYSRTHAAGEKIGHIPADKTYITYDNDARPHVEVHNRRKDVPNWLSEVFFIDWMNSWSTEYYVLVVPEGTITNTGEYAIDMN